MNILHEFYMGNIKPSAKTVNDPEIKKCFAELIDFEERLAVSLKGEDSRLFEQYADRELKYRHAALEDRFLYGFRLGAIMMMDLFVNPQGLLRE